jgi:hypothetical protein
MFADRLGGCYGFWLWFNVLVYQSMGYNLFDLIRKGITY